MKPAVQALKDAIKEGDEELGISEGVAPDDEAIGNGGMSVGEGIAEAVPAAAGICPLHMCEHSINIV